MAITVKQRADLGRMILAAALVSTFLGCTGPLIYRPGKKVKPDSVASISLQKKYHLPPQPDQKANDATLAGIDSAGVGVRDDVNISIYTNYSSTRKRAVLMGMAKDLQVLIVATPKTKEQARKVQQSLNHDLALLHAVPGIKRTEASDMEDRLNRQSFNTPARFKTYLDYNLLLEGDQGSP